MRPLECLCLNRMGRLRLVRSCIFPFLDDSPVRPYPCSFLLECTHVCLLSRQQSLRNSPARLALFLCTLVMFLVSTVHLILHIVQYIVQVPYICDIDPLPSDVQEIWNATYAGLALLERLQYLISDAIVVWRAVVIWPRNWWVIGGMSFCLFVTAGESCHRASGLHITVEDANVGSHDFGWLTDSVFCAVTSIYLAVLNVLTVTIPHEYSTVEKNMLGTFPLMFTNAIATILIAYKTW